MRHDRSRRNPSIHRLRPTVACLAALVSAPGMLLAAGLPSGATVVQGQASVSTQGQAMVIHQSSNKLAINWQSFNVGAGQSVSFQQPSPSAVALNRVVGNEKSVIDGALSANGQVFIINSNGVLFGKGSSVATAGLVASTLKLSDADFMAGRHTWQGGSTASVSNAGKLTSAAGGYIALLGATVTNDGHITAPQGTVVLASGQQITLDLSGDALLHVRVSEGALNALVANRGAIVADGGQVILTAQAADALLGSQVNNSGVVQARTLGDLTGSITLLASGGTTTVAGTLDASAPNGGSGGQIDTSGTHVHVTDGAVITTSAPYGATGAWTVDPDGFTIGAGGDISGAQLSNLLASNNVALASTAGGGTDGNLTVNDSVSWSANTRLTLSATHDIVFNSAVAAHGDSAGLVLNMGGDYQVNMARGAALTLGGAHATLNISGHDYVLIHDMAGLAGIKKRTPYYALAQDLTATTAYTAAVLPDFYGTLAGLGHHIDQLNINAPGSSLVGLIGHAYAGSSLRDLALTHVSVIGGDYTGGLVGDNLARIDDVSVSGQVTGSNTVGGLVGLNYNGVISNAQADVNVKGVSIVGGLVGSNSANTLTTGIIQDSWATGAVSEVANDTGQSGFGGLVGSNSGSILRSHTSTAVSFTSTAQTSDGNDVGGLVGVNTKYATSAGLISQSYATGSVTSVGSYVGGLVGRNIGGLIDQSYATGRVANIDTSTTSREGIGGLVGSNESPGTVTYSYASGDVNAPKASYVGGLVGLNRGVLDNVHATGNVVGSRVVGGLVGQNFATISHAYATGDVSGVEVVGGFAGSNSSGNPEVTRASITDSSASGNVTGDNAVGGFAGGNSDFITGATATGSVNGATNVGGLVGMNNGDISFSTASGNVNGSENVGGLVGWNLNGPTVGNISDSSATGSVNGSGPNVGGLIGSNTSSGTVTNSSYHDVAAEEAAKEAAEKAAEEAAAKAAAEAAAKAAAEAAAKAAAEAAAKAAAEAAAEAAAKAAADAAAKAAAEAAAKAAAALAHAAMEARVAQGVHIATQTTAAAQRAAELRHDDSALGVTASAPPDSPIRLIDPRNFSADVRRIEVDGEIFDLDDEDSTERGASK